MSEFINVFLLGIFLAFKYREFKKFLTSNYNTSLSKIIYQINLYNKVTINIIINIINIINNKSMEMAKIRTITLYCIIYYYIYVYYIYIYIIFTLYYIFIFVNFIYFYTVSTYAIIFIFTTWTLLFIGNIFHSTVYGVMLLLFNLVTAQL